MIFQVAILVPLKILLRFVPFLIAYSVAATSDEPFDVESTGYFNVVSGEIAGQWLRTWYFIGSIVCFLGFYNAMVINAERTAFYFCEEHFAGFMGRTEASRNWFTRWLFAMPAEGGIRRIYTIVVAALECIFVTFFPVGLLIELEMLIYALSAALFFYSFVYLRSVQWHM